jgi:hypothetical protein
MSAADIKMAPQNQISPAGPHTSPAPLSAPQIKAAGDADAARTIAQGQVAHSILSAKIVGCLLGGLLVSLVFCMIWQHDLFKEYATAVIPVLALGIGNQLVGHKGGHG